VHLGAVLRGIALTQRDSASHLINARMRCVDTPFPRVGVMLSVRRVIRVVLI
jgi:hypothetical protein